jgi:hypothetical protein
MDAIIARIKGYVLVIYPTVLADLSMTDAQLNLVIQDVVNRALAFTRRDQLVYRYEKDLVKYPMNDDTNDEFWGYYTGFPVPAVLEQSLANTVVGVMKNVKNRNTTDTGAVSLISDNGQEIRYSDVISNFLNSSDDADVFSGSVKLLEQYTIPVIPKSHGNTYTIWPNY